jgi:hypothetical protein
MSTHRFLVAALVATTSASAQQSTIPVRSLSASVSTDSGVFRAITTVRPMSDGRVLVHDVSLRRLVLFEPTLKTFKVVADTSSVARNKYGSRPAGLIPYLGDSSVFVDTDAQALIVVDPAGAFGRVIALPKGSDLYLLANPYGTPGFDPKGRLVYRGIKRQTGTANPSINPVEDAGKTKVGLSFPDSAPIVRADFDTRSVDTIAMMRLPTQKIVMHSPARLVSCGALAVNPLPTTDEWALLPDGTVAVVRSQDYHIDWWDASGAATSTPKMPFGWKRITLEEREALLDSLRKADEARRAAAPPSPPPTTGAIPCRAPFTTVDAVDMADYYPPIRAGQFKADRDGNVWVLPSTSTLSTPTNTGLVWDVVNRKGEIIEHVKLPEGRNLAGFGPGGVVYMIYAPSPQRILLERATVVR